VEATRLVAVERLDVTTAAADEGVIVGASGVVPDPDPLLTFSGLEWADELELLPSSCSVPSLCPFTTVSIEERPPF
jgi:hypothetical protein